MTNTATLIIPIDISRRPKEIFKRAVALAENISKEGFLAIFSINFKDDSINNKLLSILSSIINITVVKAEGDNVPLAKIRNTAISRTVTEYILFLDADIVFDANTIRYAIYKAIEKKSRLTMLPCLYLTKKGSAFIENNYSTKQMIDYFFNFRRDLIMHIAFPTSLICVDTHSVVNIGGFDENFYGHGYEDFDFMIRLLSYKELMPIQESILIDNPYITLVLMDGLRADIAKTSVEELVSKKYILHLYHKKDIDDPYYINRNKNAKYFHDKWQNILKKKDITHQPSKSFLHCFLDFCNNNNIKINDYQILFDPMPRHMWRNFTLLDHIKSSIKKFKGAFLHDKISKKI
ncbi:MAG: glycosyltransferase [Campylobacteraceae bacterium]|nr:glycosyltransferase [Campylobacteraceae bacterium]